MLAAMRHQLRREANMIPLVPRGSERVIDGHALRPACVDQRFDLPAVGGVDSRRVGPICLRNRLCHSAT